MSLWVEPQRRNVIKVGVAYIVSAWLIAQVVELAADAFTAPEWLMQMLLVGLAIGFPVALLFSWIYEMTPEGIKLEKDVDRSQSITPATGDRLNQVTVGILSVAVALLLADRFLLPASEVAVPPAVEQAEPAPTDASKSVAVLPFVNMSPDADNEYFADGLSEELLNLLAQIEDLKVAGRTSSFAFKGQNTDLREIGAQLNVGHLVEGSVRKAGNRVRITAQLIRTDDGFHLWSDSYDRELTDVFAVQDEIATAIAKALTLKLDLAVASSSASSADPQVFDMYLEARGLLAHRDRANLARALDLLEKAVEKDAGFGKAWAALAQARALSFYYSIADKDSAIKAARVAAQKALAIDPNLVLANGAMADILRDEHRFMEAESLYLRMIKRYPNEAEIHIQYAQFLNTVGRLSDSVTYARTAHELDPLAWIHIIFLADAHLVLRNYDRAAELIQRARSLNDDVLIKRIDFLHALATDNLDAARTIASEMAAHDDWDAAGRQIINDGVRDALLADSGGTRILESAFADPAAQPEDIDSVYVDYRAIALFLGDMNPALKFLGKSQMFRREMGWFWQPVFSPIWSTPEFRDALEETGVVEYWRQSSWSDFCRPTGESFECGYFE